MIFKAATYARSPHTKVTASIISAAIALHGGKHSRLKCCVQTYLRSRYVYLAFNSPGRLANNLLLTRLEPLLDTLRDNHNALRTQNERVVSTGVAMEQMLKPMEDGVRVRHERKVAENARLTSKGGGVREEKEADVVQDVGQR